MQPTLRRSLLATAAALALVGCGSNTTGSNAASLQTEAAPHTAGAPKLNENQTADAAQAALHREFAAFQSGDARAVYALMAEDCEDLFGDYAVFETEFADALETVEIMTGSKLSEMTLGDVRLVEFTPERASFQTTIYLADGTPVLEHDDEEQPDVMVYEDGEWKGQCMDPSLGGETEMQFETVGEEIEMTTTVTSVPPSRPTSSTTVPGKMPR